MTTITNPLMGRNFTESALTQWINMIPIEYNFISQLKLFEPIPVNTSTVTVEAHDFQNQLVIAQLRGEKSEFLREKLYENMQRVTMEIPRLAVDDSITPRDVQDRSSLGLTARRGNNTLATVNEIMQLRMQRAKQNIMTTAEYFKMGALQGQILNTNGNLLYDLFDKFNRNQTTINFDLANNLTKVREKCNEVTRTMDIALNGASLTGYMCIASDTFFDSFTEHDSVKEAYAGYQAADTRLGGDVRRSFRFAGIELVNYNPIVKGPNETNVTFLTEGEAIFFPIGTKGIFQYIIGPADTFETVNTLGQEFYARSWVSDDGQKRFIHSESNVLPICANPSVLIRGTGA